MSHSPMGCHRINMIPWDIPLGFPTGSHNHDTMTTLPQKQRSLHLEEGGVYSNDQQPTADAMGSVALSGPEQGTFPESPGPCSTERTVFR